MQENKVFPQYVAGIDGLRAIAVLAVMVHHLWTSLLPGGFTGVDVFFVISGYVISKSLFTTASLDFKTFIIEFYKRRILRIYPALLVCLFITSAASILFIPSSWLSSTNIWTSLGAFWGASNFVLVWSADGYFSQRVAFNPFLHTWSLAVEEQFYLFFPAVFYLWCRWFVFKDTSRGIGIRISRGLLQVLAAISLAYAYYSTARHPDQAYYLLPSRFWELAAGAILFTFHARGKGFPQTKAALRLFSFSGACLLCISFAFSNQAYFPFPSALFPVSGALLIIVTVAASSVRVSPAPLFLQSRVLTYLGRASYSLYLWHWPVNTFFRWTVGLHRPEYKGLALLVTFTLAMVSYHFVESHVRNMPALQRRNSREMVKYGSIAVFASFMMTGILFSFQSSLSLSVTKDRYNWYQYPDRLQGLLRIIFESDNIAQKLPAFLSKNRKHGSGHHALYVVGDSHAGAYSAMFDDISAQSGLPVYKYYGEGCSPANLIRPIEQFDFCKEFIEQALARLEERAKPGDIVFIPSLRMSRLGDQLRIYDEESVTAEQAEPEAVRDRRIALDEADHLIDRLEQKGLSVLLDAPLPIFKSPPCRCSDWFNRMNPICASGFTMNRDVLLKHREPVMDSLNRLKTRHDKLYVWDPFAVLCDKDICSAFDGDKPLFFDQDHLSGHGARMLAPSFKEVLQEIAGEK